MNNGVGNGVGNSAANGAVQNGALNNAQSGAQLTRQTSTTNPNGTLEPSLDQPKSIDGILQVLFLLSLVVNFYLGILIRKLLMRYRSLLTNVRQAAYT